MVLGVVLGLLLPSACLSPTLPLPPPDKPEKIEGPDSQGYVQMSGTMVPGAVAYARNQVTSEGSFKETNADGFYQLRLRAEVGNGVLLWYTLNGERSQAVRFEIPAPVP
jgi:hypothetical protein